MSHVSTAPRLTPTQGRTRATVILDPVRGVNYHGNRATYARASTRYGCAPIIVTEKPDTFGGTRLPGGTRIAVVKSALDTFEIQRAISSIIGSQEIAAIVPGFEDQVEVAAALRGPFGVPGADVPTVMRFRDKSTQHERLRRKPSSHYVLPVAIDELGARRGISLKDELLAFVALQSGSKQPGYPIIVKLRGGSGSRQVYRIDNMQDLDDTIARVEHRPEDYRAEEFIHSPYGQLHVDGFFHEGVMLDLSVSQYTYELLEFKSEKYPGTISRRHDDSPIVRAAKKATQEIAQSLDPTMTAPVHFEFFIRPLFYNPNAASRERNAFEDPQHCELVFGEGPRRLPGGPAPAVYEALTGVNLADTWLAAQLDRDFNADVFARQLKLCPNEVGALLLRTQKRGLITQIETAAELRARCPGVLMARIAFARGDTVGDPDRSAASLGFALITGQSRSLVFERMKEAQDNFSIDTMSLQNVSERPFSLDEQRRCALVR